MSQGAGGRGRGAGSLGGVELWGGVLQPREANDRVSYVEIHSSI